MDPSRVVSEIFNVENIISRLWNPGQGQSRSLKVDRWYYSIDLVWFPISVL